MQLMAVAIGGALGAVARWSLTGWVHATLGASFPTGTLIVNVTGSLALGVVASIADASVSTEVLRSAIAIGFLGAFTTFSTFSLEAVRLIQDGEPERALAYIGVSVVLGLLAVWAGLEGGRWMIDRLG